MGGERETDQPADTSEADEAADFGTPGTPAEQVPPGHENDFA